MKFKELKLILNELSDEKLNADIEITINCETTIPGLSGEVTVTEISSKFFHKYCDGNCETGHIILDAVLDISSTKGNELIINDISGEKPKVIYHDRSPK